MIVLPLYHDKWNLIMSSYCIKISWDYPFKVTSSSKYFFTCFLDLDTGTTLLFKTFPHKTTHHTARMSDYPAFSQSGTGLKKTNDAGAGAVPE
jgi:hypothetical protein